MSIGPCLRHFDCKSQVVERKQLRETQWFDEDEELAEAAEEVGRMHHRWSTYAEAYLSRSRHTRRGARQERGDEYQNRADPATGRVWCGVHSAGRATSNKPMRCGSQARRLTDHWRTLITTLQEIFAPRLWELTRQVDADRVR